MTALEVTEAIAKRLDSGGISRRQAEQLLGFVLLEAVKPETGPGHATYYRRCGALRQLGLDGSDRWLMPVEVDFGQPNAT